MADPLVETVHVGAREIGPGQPCFIVAEVGINHNGDVELAERTIDAAAAAGADAVKFQNFRTEDFIADDSLTWQYTSGGATVTETQLDMFKRCELAREDLQRLAARCRDRGVTFFSTPTSESGIREAVAAGAPLLKNGSDYLLVLPLIEAMARTGLPTVVSTGMATLAEIDDAVGAFREAGGTELVLLHCTSSYPTPIEDVHLRKMKTLQLAFGCPVGLSDHSEGIVAAVAAVTLGACMIEKHFTLDRDLPGPDHAMSSDPVELAQLVMAIRSVERALGSPSISPAASEELGRRQHRVTCVAAFERPAGHRLREEDVAFRRPGTGAPPKAAGLLVGRVLARDVEAGDPLRLEDLA